MNPRALVVLAFASCSGASTTAPPPAAVPPPVAATPAPAAAPVPMSLAETGIVPGWIDAKADPCQDFFEHACGTFVRSSEIPADRSSWSAIMVLSQQIEELLRDVLEKAARDPGGDPDRKKIGDAYAACMDEAAIEKAGVTPLQPLLDVIAKVDGAKAAAKAVTELHAAGTAPFFYLYQTQDFADATQVVGYLDQAGLGLPDRDYYLKDTGNMKTVRTTYRDHVGRIFALLGRKPAEARAAAADVMRIETALARKQQDKVTRRDPHAIWHRIDRQGLEKIASDFPWGDYLTQLGIGGVTAIAVNQPAYYTFVTKLMKSEQPAALRNYLTLRLLSNWAPQLGKAFVDEDQTMTRALRGTEKVPPRSRRCYEEVDSDLGFLLGKVFVGLRFSGEAKPRAVELTRAVLAEMDRHLDSLPWMDAPTRAAAKQKAARMGYQVGFPDQWRHYDFEVSRTDHAANVLAATRFEVARQLAKIGKPVDRGDWDMTPPTVNAQYSPTLNQMDLPAGQLQPPFFGAGFHPAVNFGSTGGGTIGHEMTHGFDDEGSQFDADGNLRDWWSAPTKQQFEKAAQCVVDQYAQYDAVPGLKLNGKLTAGENIADIGGVKLALQAYRTWKGKQATPPPAEVGGYSDEQIYFLAYGQSWCAKVRPETEQTRALSNPHSPPRWRVNGVVVDQPEFAAAFKCAAGTPMNPGKSCTVW